MNYLGTYHSTFLSYDINNNKLYNGKRKKDFIIYEQNNLNYYLSAHNKYIKFENGIFSLSDDPCYFTFFKNKNGTISIKLDNGFLSAKPDSSVTIVEQIQGWEQFTFNNLHKIDPSKIGFIDYLDKREGETLNLACCCGNINYGECWFCTDLYSKKDKYIYELDITKKFFFPSSTFNAIYIEHGLEHVDFNGVLNFLIQSFRVMKMGAILRISSPMLDKLFNFYISTDNKTFELSSYIQKNWYPSAFDMNIKSKAFAIDNAFHNFNHKCILDYDAYSQILKAIGFSNVYKCEIGKSNFELLNNLERRTDYYAQCETQVLEAIK